MSYHLWIMACGPFTPEETLGIAREVLGEGMVLSAAPVSEALQEYMFTARIEVADACATRVAAERLIAEELTAFASEPVFCACGGDSDMCFTCGGFGLTTRWLLDTPDPAKIDRRQSHKLFLRAKRGKGARPMDAGAVSDLWTWCGERGRHNNDLATPRWHPTLPGVVEIEIQGSLTEATFHVWDGDFDVWGEDTLNGQPWARECRSAPVLCAACKGDGCKACEGYGVTPSPIDFP